MIIFIVIAFKYLYCGELCGKMKKVEQEIIHDGGGYVPDYRICILRVRPFGSQHLIFLLPWFLGESSGIFAGMRTWKYPRRRYFTDFVLV